MPTIVLTNSYSDDVLSTVKPLIPRGFDFVNLEDVSKTALLKSAPLADYFLASGRLKIDADVITAAQNLKMIQRTGVGLDGLDLEFLKTKNIPVYVNKGVNARSVAEHTILLILAVLRKITTTNRLTKQGTWVKNAHGLQTHSLYGKTVGLIGLGSIGIEVAKMLKPFGCKVLYYKRNALDSKDERAIDLHAVGFDELIRESNIISLHCSLNDETKHLLNDSEFEKMKPGSFIINTARGGIVDEMALIKYLKSGHLAGAGLDVFEKEPIDKDNELLKMENVLVSAHVSGITKESYEDMILKAVHNIVAFHNRNLEEIIENKLNF